MFDIRLRLSDETGAKGRVLDTLSISFAGVDSSTARLEFSVSRKIAGDIPEGQVVALEYSIGGQYVSPRNDLFICAEGAEDALDSSETLSFTASALVPWLTQRCALWWKPGEYAESRTYTDATPGAILSDLITIARSEQGWGRYVSIDFNAWSERVTQTYQFFTTSLSRVISALAEQGYIEWWTEGNKLRVVNAGTGSDLRETVVLGGPGFTRAPRRSSYDPLTVLVVKGDFGWTHIENPGSDGRFGSLMQVMTQAGVPTREAAVVNAQPTLTGGRAVQQELSYDWIAPGWTPAPLEPIVTPNPFSQVNIGDAVTARTRGGREAQRVVGLVVEKRDGRVTARATVGDKLLSQTVKTAKRANAATVGQIIGGSGSSLPPSPAAPSVAPNPPESVRVTRNQGAWNPDGSASSEVMIAWDRVTQAVDQSRIDIDLYELWSREAADLSALTTATTDLSTLVTSWRPGIPRFFKIRARSRAGVWSNFSTEISVTPQIPASIVPAVPAGLEVESNIGVFRPDGSTRSTVTIGWDAVTSSIEGEPVTITSYQLWDGTETEPGIVAGSSAGTRATLSWPGGLVRWLRVRAQSDAGNWSDFSDPVQFTTAQPAADMGIPTAPTLETGVGIVSGKWNGQLTTGAPAAGFQHVLVEANLGSGWTRLAMPVPRGGGSFNIRATNGTLVLVRLVPVDTLGRVGTASDVAEIVSVGTGADDIIVGSIQVNHLSPAVGESLDLASNGTVNIIISQQAQQAQELAQAGSQISTAQDAADAAAAAATTAQAGVDNVQSQVETVQGDLSAAQEQIAGLSTWFRFDIEGAHVGQTGSPFQTHIKPDRFEITEQGVPRAWLEAGRLVAPSFEGQEVILSNHKLERFGTGTVVRRLG
jgi:hypothetical protein